jgi:hypothetical protein
LLLAGQALDTVGDTNIDDAVSDELVEQVAKAMYESEAGKFSRHVEIGALDKTKQLALYRDEWFEDAGLYDKIPKLEMTCELQVRTLTEETWGEIDHFINYPHPTTSVPLHEQIRVLARATSIAARLADAIFATLADEEKRAGASGVVPMIDADLLTSEVLEVVRNSSRSRIEARVATSGKQKVADAPLKKAASNTNLAAKKKRFGNAKRHGAMRNK